ncbi:hypothetical protein H8959_022729 [Pygathrix nigripes]
MRESPLQDRCSWKTASSVRVQPKPLQLGAGGGGKALEEEARSVTLIFELFLALPGSLLASLGSPRIPVRTC